MNGVTFDRKIRVVFIVGIIPPDRLIFHADRTEDPVSVRDQIIRSRGVGDLLRHRVRQRDRHVDAGILPGHLFEAGLHLLRDHFGAREDKERKQVRESGQRVAVEFGKAGKRIIIRHAAGGQPQHIVQRLQNAVEVAVDSMFKRIREIVGFQFSAEVRHHEAGPVKSIENALAAQHGDESRKKLELILFFRRIGRKCVRPVFPVLQDRIRGGEDRAGPPEMAVADKIQISCLFRIAGKRMRLRAARMNQVLHNDSFLTDKRL